MTLDPRTRIGHVHLTVSDLERAVAFYRDVLGFDVTTRYGKDAVYRDRPVDEWPRGPDGVIVMHTRPLDLERLLQEA
ncbi:MAG: VOC family protein [Gemmatimonadales bacterium]